MRGDSSSITAPCSGQAKFSENVRIVFSCEVLLPSPSGRGAGGEGKISTIAIPSARFKQVARESVNLS